MRESPMFPLSTVLFPASVLPLHVFEPRYRALVHDCLSEKSEFGIVLISRGSEVGGGDERVRIGTSASIEAAQPIPDGRWALVVRGTRRIRVVEWLEDAPYPRAVVEALTDETVEPVEAGGPEGPQGPEGAALFEGARRALVRLHALMSELDAAGGARSGSAMSSAGPSAHDVLAAMEVSTDRDADAWAMCALAPFTALDRQKLLEAPDLPSRLAILKVLSDELSNDLEHLLAAGR